MTKGTNADCLDSETSRGGQRHFLLTAPVPIIWGQFDFPWFPSSHFFNKSGRCGRLGGMWGLEQTQWDHTLTFSLISLRGSASPGDGWMRQAASSVGRRGTPFPKAGRENWNHPRFSRLRSVPQLRPSDPASGSTATACVVRPGERTREEKEADRVGGGRKEGGGAERAIQLKRLQMTAVTDSF